MSKCPKCGQEFRGRSLGSHARVCELTEPELFWGLDRQCGNRAKLAASASSCTAMRIATTNEGGTMKRSLQKGESSANGGIGVLGLLGVVFVTLKLLAIEPVASWSWWWVTAPFWGGLALVLAVLAVVVVVWFFGTALSNVRRRY